MLDIYKLKKEKRRIIDHINNRNVKRVSVIQDAIENWDKQLHEDTTTTKLQNQILTCLEEEILDQNLIYKVKHNKVDISAKETIHISLQIMDCVLAEVELTNMQNLTSYEEHEVMDTMNQCLDITYLWLAELGFTVDKSILNSSTTEYHDCIRNNQIFTKNIKLTY